MKADITLLKKLRLQTGAGVADCRVALEDTKNDFNKAVKLIEKRGIKKAEKKKDKETSDGMLATYVHANGKIGVLLELKCQTDFVARTDDFQKLAHELTLQIAAMNPKDEKALLKSAYIRDASLTIEKLVKKEIAKLGENITIGRFIRYELGEE